MLFAQGWWLVVCAAGAIFLPYVAVVLANVSGPTRSTEVLRPGGLVPRTPAVSDTRPEPDPRSEDADVDAPADAGADADAAEPPDSERGAA
jgi:hypothetical protein